MLNYKSVQVPNLDEISNGILNCIPREILRNPCFMTLPPATFENVPNLKNIINAIAPWERSHGHGNMCMQWY